MSNVQKLLHWRRAQLKLSNANVRDINFANKCFPRNRFYRFCAIFSLYAIALNFAFALL